MGWGSAYRIFNNVADGLIEAGADDDVKEKTLTKLIRDLQAEDWDTELDSLQDYRNDPAIVRAFAASDIRWED
ncbi:hypothetical protein ACFCW4_02710 [Streptomyces virginiae]|uniref:hypothetical protein n=1 Tax=Streptomyces virginiae TaxID=1961 RepID=UPI0035D92253